jgi:hypothetical protein
MALMAGAVSDANASADGCPLTSPLTLSDTQEGFAGEVGPVWTVLPDCSFSIARRFGADTENPSRQGQLTRTQQTRLGVLLSDLELTTLPAEVGDGPPVNPRRLAVSYGGRRTVLILPPGETELAALASSLSSDPARRVVSFAIGISQLTTE